MSQLLGNTPAVARRSYIDPRVFDRYESGWTIAGVLGRIPDPGGIDDRIRARIERGVLDLLDDDRRSPALEKLEKLEKTGRLRRAARGARAPRAGTCKLIGTFGHV